MQYKQIEDMNGNIRSNCIQAIDDDTVMVVPQDTGNRDWMAYQAWLDAGNTPDPSDA